jgi:repressor LexA
MKSLTTRQQAVLDFIRDTVTCGGVPPSLREICHHFGFSSVKAAANHVSALRRKGYLEEAHHVARSLRLKSPLDPLRKRTVDIPVLGTVPAGFPEDLQESLEGCLTADVASLGIKANARTFALKVPDDSLSSLHVCKGDTVICQFGQRPREGDIVAALVDGESVLRVWGERRGKPMLLLPGSTVKPVPAADLVIQGPMIALIRPSI